MNYESPINIDNLLSDLTYYENLMCVLRAIEFAIEDELVSYALFTDKTGYFQDQGDRILFHFNKRESVFGEACHWFFKDYPRRRNK